MNSTPNQLKENQVKAEKWDKYSQQLETIIRVYDDKLTIDEFFQKYQLPKFLISISKDGETKMEQIHDCKKLEQQNKKLQKMVDHLFNIHHCNCEFLGESH